MRAVWSVALLIACFIGTINAQAHSSHINSNRGNNIESTNIKPQPPKENVLDEPISFNTKAKDACSMLISGQNNSTKLRVSCKNKGKTYWCDFLGKPYLCKAYNNNPLHFFTQIKWDMRKLHNACQGPQVYKPHMCRSASDDVQMIFQSSFPKISNLKPTQAPKKSHHKLQHQPKPQQPAKSASKPVKPVVLKPAPPRKPVKTITPRPTVAQGEDQSTKLAEEYCWESLQGVCSYLISWFQN